ncbi:MAG TPA: hypothetical protein VIM73_00680 [Polyangiaceae bacterium]
MGGGTAGGLTARSFSALLEEAEEAEIAEGREGANALRQLARDGRASVRAVIAELAGSLWPERGKDTLALLRELARDESALVRAASSLGLARAIYHAAPVERVGLVCEWSVAEDERERAAVARALAWPTPVFVTDLVLEKLAGDENDEVRALALRAAVSHARQSPSTYRGIAERALSDSSVDVRRAARALLARV